MPSSNGSESAFAWNGLMRLSSGQSGGPTAQNHCAGILKELQSDSTHTGHGKLPTGNNNVDINNDNNMMPAQMAKHHDINMH